VEKLTASSQIMRIIMAAKTGVIVTRAQIRNGSLLIILEVACSVSYLRPVVSLHSS
jgi:hypothetical protein